MKMRYSFRFRSASLGAFLGILFALSVVSKESRADGKCVQIFYDSAPKVTPVFKEGRTTALLVQNLLGHFPAVKQVIIPIEKYKSGDLDHCASNIYVGVYSDNPLPKEFLSDFSTSKSRVAWLGYNIEQLDPETLANLWGVEFKGLSKLDWKNQDKKGMPGFYKYYEYLGQKFEKYAVVDKKGDKPEFQGAFEIALLKLLNNKAKQNVISWAVHSVSGKKTPYVLYSKNPNARWYVGDMPTSYMTEDDRYLIFADLLFDILGEKPLYGTKGKPALLRLEDVHALVPDWELRKMFDIFSDEKVPFSISLIPLFRDPYNAFSDDPKGRKVPLTEKPDFLKTIKYALDRNATILYHGYTHQYDEEKNPTGTSGDDYEFWDVAKGKPVARDSAPYVVNRLEAGLDLMAKAGIKPTAWVTPHYAASPLDYVIFGQLFDWTVGRANYTAQTTVQKNALPAAMNFNAAGAAGNGKRLEYFKDLAVKYDGPAILDGQYYPYEIYQDTYGQRIVPEVLGFVQPKMPGADPSEIASVGTLIKRMKRNSVLRDTWASLFIHPYLLEIGENGKPVTDPKKAVPVAKLIRAAKALGYQFVDLKDWTKSHMDKQKIEVVEVTPD